MSDAKVKLIIEAATEEAKRKVQGFADATNQGFQRAEDSARNFGQSVQQSWQKAKSAWVEIAAAAYTLKKAYDLAYQAAQFKEREQAFTNMAASHGVAADRMIANLKRVSAGTIDTMTLMEKAGTAMMMGINPETVTRLMEIARGTAKMTGQSVSKAFSDIALAVGRQSKMILDNLGIIVDVEKANKTYAEALHKTSAQLSDVEKKQAFLNATLKGGEELMGRLGKQVDSAAEKMQRWQAQWKEIGITTGQVALTVLQSIDLMATGAATSLNGVVHYVTHLNTLTLGMAAKLPVVGDAVFKPWLDNLKKMDSYMSGQMEWGIKHVNDTWDALISTWKKAEPVQMNIVKNLQDQLDIAKQLAEQQKSDAEKRADAITTMYREIGMDAEAAAKIEVQKLVEKAKNWEDAGVDVLKVNEYMYQQLGRMSEKAARDGDKDVADYYGTIQQKAKFLVQEFEKTQTDALARMATVDASLSKNRALSIDDNASATLIRIKNVLDSIKDKTVRVNVETVQNSLGRSSFNVYDSAGNQLKEIEDEIAKNVKYGRSSVGGSLEDYVSGGSYVGWVPSDDELADFDMGY